MAEKTFYAPNDEDAEMLFGFMSDSFPSDSCHIEMTDVFCSVDESNLDDYIIACNNGKYDGHEGSGLMDCHYPLIKLEEI